MDVNELKVKKSQLRDQIETRHRELLEVEQAIWDQEKRPLLQETFVGKYFRIDHKGRDSAFYTQYVRIVSIVGKEFQADSHWLREDGSIVFSISALFWRERANDLVEIDREQYWETRRELLRRIHALDLELR